MARRSQRGKTRRVQVESADERSRLRPTTRVTSESWAGRAALELEQALGVAGEITEDLGELSNQRNFDQGIEDFETGEVDEERLERNRAYRKAVTQLRARSQWASDKDQIDEFLRSQDTDNMTLEELNSVLDEQFRARYDGLDDDDQADILLPRLQKYRAEKIADYEDRQREIVDTQNLADLTNVAEDVYLEAAGPIRTDDPFAAVPFDYAGLHEQIRDQLQYNGAETNEIYFKVLSDIAIRNGDPELLRNLPDNWPNGTPTFRNIPAFNERLLNSENRAQAVLDSRENAEAKRLKAERDAVMQRFENDAFLMALDGTDPGPFVDSLVRQGFMNGDTAAQIVSGFRSARDDIREQGADFSGLARLRTEIQTDPTSVNPITVYSFWADGGFGPPQSPEATNLLRTTLGDLDEARRTRRQVLSNPIPATYIRQFQTLYRPQPNLATGQVDEHHNAIYANARGEMERELAGNPDNSREIFERYSGWVTDQLTTYQSNRIANNVTEPVDLANALARGTVTPDDFVIAQRRLNVTRQTWKRMSERGEINPEVYRQILEIHLNQ